MAACAAQNQTSKRRRGVCNGSFQLFIDGEFVEAKRKVFETIDPSNDQPIADGVPGRCRRLGKRPLWLPALLSTAGCGAGLTPAPARKRCRILPINQYTALVWPLPDIDGCRPGPFNFSKYSSGFGANMFKDLANLLPSNILEDEIKAQGKS